MKCVGLLCLSVKRGCTSGGLSWTGTGKGDLCHLGYRHEGLSHFQKVEVPCAQCSAVKQNGADPEHIKML